MHYIDIEQTSKYLGISETEYSEFLKSYIDTAQNLKSDLKNKDSQKYLSAMYFLSQLSEMLNLSIVEASIKHIHTSKTSTKELLIDSFYKILSSLTTAPPIEKETSQKKYKINLQAVKPISFTFQLKEITNKLSIPTELTKEFLNDFIIQTHDKIKKILKAYKKEDISSINELAQSLKKASYNLHLNTLTNILYEIELSDNMDDLEKLIKDYWGYFLYFESQYVVEGNTND